MLSMVNESDRVVLICVEVNNQQEFIMIILAVKRMEDVPFPY